MARITRKVKYAPCGDCGEVVRRDDMHSMNIKMYTPEDEQEVRIPVRLCGSCASENLAELRDMEWSNDSMETRDEEVDIDQDDQDYTSRERVAAAG